MIKSTKQPRVAGTRTIHRLSVPTCGHIMLLSIVSLTATAFTAPTQITTLHAPSRATVVQLSETRRVALHRQEYKEEMGLRDADAVQGESARVKTLEL